MLAALFFLYDKHDTTALRQQSSPSVSRTPPSTGPVCGSDQRALVSDERLQSGAESHDVLIG